MALSLGLSRRTALLSSLFYAVCPLPAVGGRFLKEDVPVTLWLVFSQVLFVKWASSSASLWRSGLCGFTLGITLGTKLIAASFFPFLIGTALWKANRSLKTILSSIAVLTGSALFGFLLFNPWYLVEPSILFRAMEYQYQYAITGHALVSMPGWTHWWSFYFFEGLLPGLTLPVVLLACVGAWCAFKSKIFSLPFTVLCLWAVSFYFAIETAPAKPWPYIARYLHPVIPMIVIFAGVGSSHLIEFARLQKNVINFSLQACFWGCMLIPIGMTVLILEQAKNGPREAATRFIEEKVALGERVLVSQAVYTLNGKRPRPKFIEIHRTALSLELVREGNADWLLTSSLDFDRYRFAKQSSPRAQMISRRLQEIDENCPSESPFRPSPTWAVLGPLNPTISVYKLSRCKE